MIDRVLPLVPQLLSDKGVFYLLLEQRNDPDAVAARLQGAGLLTQVTQTSRLLALFLF